MNLKLHTQLHFGSFSNLCVKTFIPLLLVLPIAHPRFFFRNSFLVDVGYCVRACLYRHTTALALCSLALTHTRILGQLPPMQVLGGLFSESSSSWRANQQPVQHAAPLPPLFTQPNLHQTAAVSCLRLESIFFHLVCAYASSCCESGCPETYWKHFSRQFKFVVQKFTWNMVEWNWKGWFVIWVRILLGDT